MKTSINMKCLNCGWIGNETEIIPVYVPITHPLMKKFIFYRCPTCKEIERFRFGNFW